MKETPVQTKSELRRWMSAQLRTTTSEQRRAWSERICRHLEALLLSRKTEGAVAVFGGIATEPDLFPLMHWLWGQEIPVALFRVADTEMVAHRINSPDDFLPGKKGVWEPMENSTDVFSAAELGTLLVPGLAFALDGHRLGRGAGYYDRYLAHPEVKARLIGVGFSMQMIQFMAAETHDVPVDWLVTEEKLLKCDESEAS